jgi:hypothetical protein
MAPFQAPTTGPFSAPADTLEIVHPLGYRIHVTGDVNPVTLRRVIDALDERAAR